MTATGPATPARAPHAPCSICNRAKGHTGRCRALRSRQRADSVRRVREQALADAAGVQPSLWRLPRIDHAAVEAVELELWRAEDWVSARVLAAQLGYTDRELRQIAAAADGRIISGQRGYNLTELATNEECDHAEAWLRSQAVKMIARAHAIRQARNRRRAA